MTTHRSPQPELDKDALMKTTCHRSPQHELEKDALAKMTCHRSPQHELDNDALTKRMCHQSPQHELDKDASKKVACDRVQGDLFLGARILNQFLRYFKELLCILLGELDRCSLALRRLVYDFVQRVTTSPGNLLDGLPRNPFLRHSLDQPTFCVVRMMELLLRHN